MHSNLKFKNINMYCCFIILFSDYYFSATPKYSDDENIKIATNNSNSSNNTTGCKLNSSVNNQSKRLRGKCPTTTAPVPTVAVPSTSGTSKRKVLLHRNSSLTSAVCDIRMIDFAHTTFLRKNVDSTLSSSYANAPTVQHQGPDNGFLRGIESLRRLLTEILNDEELEDEQKH